jgi:hypothetical protein
VKLSDRGAGYQDEPIEMYEGFPGADQNQDCPLWCYPRHMPVPQGPIDRKCRGIAHSTHQPAESEFAALNVKPVVSAGDTLMSTAKHSVKQEVAKMHRANLLENLEHRLQVARSRGDQELIRQLEKEKEQIS